MKDLRSLLFVLVGAIVVGLSPTVYGAGTRNNLRGAVGLRYHTEHKACHEVPYEDGDLSYGVALEYHEDNAFWQLALDFAPDVGSSNNVDFALTPQLNLLFTDRGWRGGLGFLVSYVKDEVEGGDWSKLYYQFILGYSLGFRRKYSLDLHAQYVFDSWGELDKFEFKDVEFGLWLSRSF
ncbi:MAG: hypothetical protein N2255_06180 [Kiritimatiellae bacterium]|nr:hypothetical protein [Kiritimatiellia bacterium]